MNIKDAKTEIKNAITAYFTKDEFGEYEIPVEKQRPVFLMGPPGIGKTAVMEQIAQEMGVGIVSYSMTHHTRQSALGLPFIVQKNYGGEVYSVSEYTMSEIIASVYDLMETSGFREGILFLDEINCVSETLAPAMLQFLQYKIFGRHRVPPGWIVVTAGNPPEYNNSVREFDIVTWDRLKRIDVTPDYEVWKEYAYQRGAHPAILTYLDIKKADFYRIETTVEGKNFVTARGWSDLSDMIRLYEKRGLTVTEQLVSQYLQNRKTAKDFAIYYDLFNKYRADYQIGRILNGTSDETVRTRAKAAKFDERLSLLGLLLDALNTEFRNIYLTEISMAELMSALKNVRTALTEPKAVADSILQSQIVSLQKKQNSMRYAGVLSTDVRAAQNRALAALEENRASIIREHPADGASAFALMKNNFDRCVKELKNHATATGVQLSNVFHFCEEVFPDGQEVLILVTELTMNSYASRFISRYGCEAYFAHNKELLFYERQQKLIADMEKLEL